LCNPQQYVAGDDLNCAVTSTPAPTSEDTTVTDEVVALVLQDATPPPSGPTRLATVEERLLRLQADFTQHQIYLAQPLDYIS